ncbi:hypothetical protein PTKIN_Ptkin15bG0107600 [Pterospermum kingtungense]
MTKENFRKHKKTTSFDSLPMSYTQLYPQLLERSLVVPTFTKPFQPQFPKWYNANKQCEYHGGISGHDFGNCVAFRHKVQSLIDNEVLKFASRMRLEVNVNFLSQLLEDEDTIVWQGKN